MIKSLCWLLHKDLLMELRSRRAWTTMLLMGIVVSVIFSVHSDQVVLYKQQIVGGSLWMAIFLAGIPMTDRCFAAEQENGCWDGLRLLPVAPATIYWAKLLVNVVALALLECLLIPLLLMLSNVRLAASAAWLVPVAALANVGLAAAGTVVGSLSLNRRGGGQFIVVVLPLVIPVLLAAAECTRLVAVGSVGEAWWRWIQLLAIFDVIFVGAGVTLFKFAIED